MTAPQGAPDLADRSYRASGAAPAGGDEHDIPRDLLAHVETVAKRSGSSFLGAIRLLPRQRREAMFAVYAYCREIDDIADEPMPEAERARLLAEWRHEVDLIYTGAPALPTAQALVGPVQRYGIDRLDLLALIDGMEMDAQGIQAPTLKELNLYCARVAGAVGLISIRVFGDGSARARDVANALGNALQLTNILRDLQEDAERGRLYLPCELLERHGIETRDPQAVMAHPALPAVCNDLAAMARESYAEAEAAMRDCVHSAMRAPRAMMHVYRRILERLERAGWHDLHRRVRLPVATKLWIALRYGLI